MSYTTLVKRCFYGEKFGECIFHTKKQSGWNKLNWCNDSLDPMLLNNRVPKVVYFA